MPPDCSAQNMFQESRKSVHMFIYKCLFLEGRKVLVYRLGWEALTGLYQGKNSRREKQVLCVFVHVKPVRTTCTSSSV